MSEFDTPSLAEQWEESTPGNSDEEIARLREEQGVYLCQCGETMVGPNKDHCPACCLDPECSLCENDEHMRWDPSPPAGPMEAA